MFGSKLLSWHKIAAIVIMNTRLNVLLLVTTTEQSTVP